MFSWRVRPSREQEFQAWLHGVIAAAARYRGHLGATVLQSPDGRDYHLVYRFSNPNSLRAWLDSDERRDWLTRVEPLTETHTGLQQRTGLETWFQLPGGQSRTTTAPPRWKMWLTSLVAVYPLVLLFQAFLAPAVADWPLAVRAALFPLVLLTAMTYLVMPLATRLARRFLYP